MLRFRPEDRILPIPGLGSLTYCMKQRETFRLSFEVGAELQHVNIKIWI